jgi:hypothetical protein
MSVPVSEPITRFLSDDHDRLEGLLARAVARPDAVDSEAYEAFRAGLLRHIALEEKVLVAEYRQAGPTDPAFEEMARRLRVDHGAIALLLVPSPTRELVQELRSILEPHDAVEEGPAGFYARCEVRLAARAGEIVARMRDYPQVRTLPHNDGAGVYRTAAAALAVSGRQAAATRRRP